MKTFSDYDLAHTTEEELTQFHKTLIFLDKPAVWRVWAVALSLLVINGFALLFWWWLSQNVQTVIFAGGILLLATLFDGVIFWSMPKRGLSFGAWQSHLILLAIIRAFAASMAAVITVFFTDGWALAILAAIQAAATAGLYWGAVVEPFNLGLTEVLAASDKLPTGQEPVRILHITDLHIERLTKREESLLKLARRADPDLILITGDYLNLSTIHDKEAHNELRQLLGQLSAPQGVFAVLGSPSVDEREVVPGLFDELEIELLINQEVRIELDDGRTLILIGVDCTQDRNIDRANLMRLAAKSGDGDFKLLMYHTPDLFPDAASCGTDLYLCGHTHGGQIRLPLIGALFTSSHYGRRYQMGEYRNGGAQMYVSRGVGMEGLAAPRVRFLCPPEITLVTIQPKTSPG